jgi:hypothetical protein
VIEATFRNYKDISKQILTAFLTLFAMRRACGSKMEMGYIASRMIAWSDKKISNWSFKGLWRKDCS